MGVNIKKLDEIFTLIDKVNQATVRGLFPQAGKEAVIERLQREVLETLEDIQKPSKPVEKVEQPKEEKPEKKK